MGQVPGESEQRAPEADGGRRRTGRTVALAGFAVALAAAVTIPLVTLGGGDDTPSTADREAVAARIAAQATDTRVTDPALAARLSLAAYRIAPVGAARDALIASFGAATAVRTPAAGSPARGVAFSPSGPVLATAGTDGALRFYRLTDGGEPTLLSERPTQDESRALAFDQDGDRLALSGTADPARLWDVADPANPRQLAVLAGLGSPVQVALSADGTLLAAATGDGTFGLWRLTNPAAPEPPRLQRTMTVVTDMALNPAGNLLATAGIGGDIQLWDITNPERPVRTGVASGAVGAVNAIAFSGDGKRLAAGGDDRTVRVWDVGDPRNSRRTEELTGHDAPVSAVVFGAGGQIVSGDQAGVVTYWSGSGPAAMARVDEAGSAVLAMAVDQAGERLATTTSDGQTTVWSVNPDRLVTAACADPAARISESEWNERIPDLPYTDPCHI